MEQVIPSLILALLSLPSFEKMARLIYVCTYVGEVAR